MDQAQVLRAVAKPIVKQLAPLGWALHTRWHYKKSHELAGRVKQGAPQTEIDEAITELWNTQSEVFLRNVALPLGRFGMNIDTEFQRINQRRVILVGEAFKCHQAEHYSAAILLTYAQIDGLTRDVTGASFFSTSSNDKFLDNETLAGIEENLPTIREAFNQTVDTTGFHGLLSRHGAVHGRDLAYGDRVNSTKALVLLGALIEYLPDHAAKKARKMKRKRDVNSKGLEGVDGKGRLLDDRELDQLCSLLAESNSKIWNEFLMSSLNRSELEPYFHQKLKEKNLSRARFTLHGVDPSFAWWSYRTPAGQILGAAILKWRDPEVKIAQIWVWDSQEAPEQPPWETEEGWVVDDPNGGATPNWSFEW